MLNFEGPLLTDPRVAVLHPDLSAHRSIRPSVVYRTIERSFEKIVIEVIAFYLLKRPSHFI